MARNGRYFYNGITLREYCILNHLNYSKYLARVRHLIGKQSLSVEEAVKIAIDEYTDSRCNFYYQGMSLKKYCDEHEYNYQKIYRKVKNIENEEEIKKLIDAFIMDNPTSKRTYYNIDGLSLSKYCKKHNYVYPTLKTYIQNIIKTYPDMSRDEVVESAILFYQENHDFKEKFFYRGERLIDYCKRNHLEYANIWSYLSRICKDSHHITEEEMEEAIYKFKIKVRRDDFNLLNKMDKLEDCLEILNRLNIDLQSIQLVMNFNLDFREAILFVWYFGIENESGITIDIKRIEIVYGNLKNLESLEINELLGYYKAKIFDTRDIIYDKTFLSVRKIISNLCKKYNITHIEFIEELKAIADYMLFDFIERSTSRYLGQIINYMNASIKGNLKRHILEEIKVSKNIGLDDYKYGNGCSTRENIVDIDSEYFGKEILTILNTLTEMERKFIFLKYQKQYHNEEISHILNMSLAEIEQYDFRILSQLRERADVKCLIKNRSK